VEEDEDADDRKIDNIDDNATLSFGPKIVTKIFNIKFEEDYYHIENDTVPVSNRKLVSRINKFVIIDT